MNTIGIILLTAILFVNILIFVFIGGFILRTKELLEQFVEFVTSPDDKTPSALANFVDMASHRAGQAAAMEIKTTLMGKASGDSRAIKAMQGDVVGDMAESQGMLGGLMQASPSLNKRLRKNPDLIGLAMQYLPAILGGGNGNGGGHPAGGGGGVSSSPKFKL